MTENEPPQPQPAEATGQDNDQLQHQLLNEHHLPTGGEFPYVPPKNWKPKEPLRKNSKGEYLDCKGRRWRKGPTRTEGEQWEWDVQLPNGEHLNIDWGGIITHPKRRSQRKIGQSHRGLGGKGKKNRRRKR